MSGGVLAVLGIASGVVLVAGLFPYIRDILLLKTQPERATWWIWSVLNIVALFALVDAGAKWQLAMNVAQTFCVGLIAVLSLKYGYGKLQRRDFLSLIVAVVGIVLWRLTHEPVLAIVLVVGVDAVGFWLTLSKSWKAPHSETLSAWIFASVSGILGVAAVGELSFTKLLYPLYIAIGNCMLVALIYYRRPLVMKPKMPRAH